MTIYAGTIVDTPGDPFDGDPADALAEAGAVCVREGVICARGTLAALCAEYPGEPVTRLPDGMLVPGFVDAHVHFPQIRAIGGLGMPLLDWLERCALPEESKLASQAYAREVAGEFLAACSPRERPARSCSDRTSRPPWRSCSPRPSTPA